MRLYTSPGLAYPITVTKIYPSEDDNIEQSAPIFSYSYQASHTVYDKDAGKHVQEPQTLYADYESEIEGTVREIGVRVGQVITARTPVADIDEPCKHEVQFGGMCANCGKDMTTVRYSTTVANTARATINTDHAHTSLLVSREEAGRADEEAKKRLLESRKLSLVVDLDQTIIHATVDPTVAEWQLDESNPNHEAVKHVRKFQLVDDGPGGRGTWYYIKLRPGLAEFLQTVSQHYELHIYTMATRAYAEEIAKLVDPDRKLFANRILSRDENGSMNSKSLKRLFPVDTKMVVIIDDRGDVWSWSPNLVKVSAYDFFVGIGDINSSFLPKRPELEARPPKPTTTTDKDKDGVKEDGKTEDGKAGDGKTESSASATPPETNRKVSAVDRMISMAGKQDDSSMEEKTEEQDKTIAAQVTDRPLLQKQKILDAADDEAEAKESPAVEAAAELLAEHAPKTETAPEHPKHRHNLLQDDDTELSHLKQNLLSVHRAYYEQYEKDALTAKTNRVTQLRPGASKKRSPEHLDNIPDAALIMNTMKSRVLAGVHIVFSGIVPIGVNIQWHDIAMWAKSFGAVVSENVSKKTTHVIASPERRTAKVRQAAKRGAKIAIVNQNWLYACFSQWVRVDEGPYRVHTDAAAQANGHGLPDGVGEGSQASHSISSSEDEAAKTEEEGTDGTADDTPAPDVDTDTDIEAELAKHRPSLQMGESNVSEEEREAQWSEIQDEFAEFMGSDAEDDSETETEGESEETTPGKRKIGEVDGAGEGEEGSRLQKRKKEALERTSSLTNVHSVVEKVEGEKEGDPGGGVEGGGEVEDEDADLEAALAAEMAKQDEDEEGDKAK